MDFSLTADQEAVRDAVQKICAGFDDDYWLEHDQSGEFPEDFYRAIADGGWLGIAMPTLDRKLWLGSPEESHAEISYPGEAPVVLARRDEEMGLEP